MVCSLGLHFPSTKQTPKNPHCQCPNGNNRTVTWSYLIMKLVIRSVPLALGTEPCVQVRFSFPYESIFTMIRFAKWLIAAPLTESFIRICIKFQRTWPQSTCTPIGQYNRAGGRGSRESVAGRLSIYSWWGSYRLSQKVSDDHWRIQGSKSR